MCIEESVLLARMRNAIERKPTSGHEPHTPSYLHERTVVCRALSTSTRISIRRMSVDIKLAAACPCKEHH